MPPSKKFYKVGDSVFGLWPGSGGLYFKAVVVDHDPADGTYDLKFEEGTVYTLLEKHVKPMDSFKALEPKTGKRTVGRPRGRSSSASRSRSRSRTPGRKPSACAPASPNKVKASSPEKIPPKEEDSKLKAKDVTDDAPLTTRRTSRVPKQEVKEEISEDMARRRSTRLAVKAETAKTDLSSSFEKKRNGNEGLNDSKTEQLSTSVPQTASTEELTRTPNILAATLHTLFVVAGVTFLHLACQQMNCLFYGVQVNKANLVSLFHPNIFLAVEGFYLLIFLLSLIPAGERGLAFRRNSIVSLLIVIATLLASRRYLNVSATLIMKHISHMLLPNFAVGALLSVIAAYQTRGSGVGLLSRFVLGTSPNASLAGVDLKVWLHRAVCLTAIALNGVAEAASIERTGTLSPVLGLVAGMQIVYSLEALWNENVFLNSFEYHHVKTGWMLFSSLAHPLMMFTITLSVIRSGITLPYYCLAPIGVAFIAGLWMKVASSLQQAAFIKDPNHPSFAHMEVLTTSSGEKLLISGWWGWLRQPNYLGDILMHWAFVLPCGYQMVMPHVVAIFMTICLLYRAQENDAMNKLKYGPAWDRYCQRVPSRVIPRVF